MYKVFSVVVAKYDVVNSIHKVQNDILSLTHCFHSVLMTRYREHKVPSWE